VTVGIAKHGSQSHSVIFTSRDIMVKLVAHRFDERTLNEENDCQFTQLIDHS
jgi:hypothetical protein